MKSLSIDTHPHDPAKDEELYELLKEGDGNTTPATSTGDDDGESTEGVNPDPYPDPDDRAANSIDAPWGEEPGETNDANRHATEVWKQVKENREDMLSKLFSGHDSNASLEQKTMGQHLSHAARGQFESSSPQLSPKSKGMPKVSSAQPETLMEMTRRVTGRH